MTLKKIIMFFLVFASSTIFAQREELDSDSVLVKKFGYAVYPILFYTPETEVGFGAGGMLFFKDNDRPDLKTSKIKLSVYLTTNKQYAVNIFPMVYFAGKNQFSLEGKLTYAKEIWKYYGIGNNTPDIDNPEYEQKSYRFYSELVAFGIFSDHFQTGPIYEFYKAEITDVKQNPYLRENEVLGIKGGKISGLGWSFLLDLRDHVFYPTKKGYYKIRALWFNKTWGSDFDYRRIVVDLRQYINLGEEHILAMQLYYDDTQDDVPFFRMPQMGGEYRMRGYFMGRYRDKKYIMFQAEYRKMFWWRIGGTAFIALGDVAGGYSQLKLFESKYVYGFGLRYLFDEEEYLNLRMDIGLGENTSGVYFSLEEAF